MMSVVKGVILLFVYIYLCHIQKGKGAAEKKTKGKPDRFDEEIASDSDEEWVESMAYVHVFGKLNWIVCCGVCISVGLLRARLKARRSLVATLIQTRKRRQLLRRD